jgi:TetR/AcrR family transcriptional repressor of lmrAB and yxaGH operons
MGRVFSAGMASDARQRMVRAATLQVSRHGVSATSFSDVVRQSGAPRGSIAYYFPGGKDQLMREALEGGERFLLRLLAGAAPRTSVDVVTVFAGAWRTVLLESDFEAGCTAVAGVVDGGTTTGLAAQAAGTFRRWQDRLAGMLQATGVPAADSAPFAALMMAACEGAVVMSRAERSITPFDVVAGQLEAMARGFDAARESGVSPTPHGV